MIDAKKAELKAHLIAARQALLETVRGISGDSWQITVQSEGDRWTALQMLRHLQDAHRGLTTQAEKILAGQENLPRDFDLDRWNARVQNKAAEMTPEQALENLYTSHEKLLALVDSLQEADLSKMGYQAHFKEDISLERFLWIIGEHEKMHTAEIAAALQHA